MNLRATATDVHRIELSSGVTRYLDTGEGECILLLHGGHFGFQNSLEVWDRNFAALGATHRVVVPDKPGQGFTDGPRRVEDCTQQFVVDWLSELVERLGLTAVHVVGHSRGGLLAAQLAVRRPDLIRSLVLVSSATLGPEPPDPSVAAQVFYDQFKELEDPRHVPTLESVALEPRANSYSVEHVTDDYLDIGLSVATAPEFRRNVALMQEGGRRLFMSSLLTAREETMRALRRRPPSYPCLVVWGENDPSANLEGVGFPLYDAIRSLSDDVSFVALPRSGHYVFREHGKGFNALIQGFVDGVAESSRL